MKKVFCLFITLFLFYYVRAQVPQTLTYQGFLTDATGNPLQEAPDLVFNIYDPTPTVVYTATINDVPISKGLFTVVLGKNDVSGNPVIPIGIWNKPLKIGIKVNGGTELTPVDLTVVPYAFMASAVYDNSISTVKIVNDAITVAKLGTDAVTNVKLADNAVNTAEIVNNAVTTAKIADDAVTLAKLGTAGAGDGTKVFVTDASGNPQLVSNLATLNVDGFSKLGSDAPAVKIKKLTGTTSGSASGTVGINHGLTATKILSVSIMVEYAAGNFIPPDFIANAGYNYNWYLTPTQIVVINVDNTEGSSTSVRGKGLVVLVTYEQ